MLPRPQRLSVAMGGGEVGIKMAKVLKVVRPEKCIGCFLCSLACSKEKHRMLSLQDSFIKIVREDGGQFLIEVDRGGCDACGACVTACPRNCLKAEDEAKE